MNAIPPKRLDPKAAAEIGAPPSWVEEDETWTTDTAAPAADDTPPAADGRAAGNGAAPADAGNTGRGAQISVPNHLSAIEVTLSVEVGSQKMALRDLLAVEPGQLFTLDRMTVEPVDILVNGRRFARGEVVQIGERYGVRLTDMVSDLG